MAGQIDPASGQVNSTLPSARLVSNVLGNQTADLLDSRNLSAFIYAWGQFVDHDLDLTNDGGTSVPIPVPTGDPQFAPTSTGNQTLPFTRSQTDRTTGTSASNPLNQITSVTSFLDGSMIYGSDPQRAAALRSFVGGQLLTSPGNLLCRMRTMDPIRATRCFWRVTSAQTRTSSSPRCKFCSCASTIARPRSWPRSIQRGPTSNCIKARDRS